MCEEAAGDAEGQQCGDSVARKENERVVISGDSEMQMESKSRAKVATTYLFFVG